MKEQFQENVGKLMADIQKSGEILNVEKKELTYRLTKIEESLVYLKSLHDSLVPFNEQKVG